jgi:hypothetical protein
MRCQTCQEDFDSERTPGCPACQARLWLATEHFIRPKHDPRELPLALEGYRSVLSPDFARRPEPYLADAARRGAWYFDHHYEMYVHVTYEPLGLAPGSGIPAGLTSPEHALDSLIIAEANDPKEAHGFAVNRAQFESQIAAGEFRALAICHEEACPNLCVPGRERCVGHS